MTIIEEVWNFAVNQGKQFMDCVIFSDKGEKLFTNSCFLKLQKGFVNMNFDKEDDFITVIMNHSVDEIKKLFNGFVLTTDYQLHFNLESGGREKYEEDTISQSKDTPLGLELQEIAIKAPVQAKRVPKKTHLCHECGKDFSSSIKLAVHRFQVHSSNEALYKCTICSKVLKTKSILYKHMFIHSEPRFSCIHCSKVWIVKSQNLIFISKQNLISISLETGF